MPQQPTADTFRLTDDANIDMQVELWAEGGYGLVFAGPCSLHDGNWRVLKMPNDVAYEQDPDVATRFVNEALVWVGLWPHANVLQAEAVTTIKSVSFLVLEYAESGNLRTCLTKDTPLAQRVLWAQMIAAGLVALHTPDPTLLRPNPLAHRDLKPENVLIQKGCAKITDLGLVKSVTNRTESSEDIQDTRTVEQEATSLQPGNQTRPGQSIGTWAYRAPEAWDNTITDELAADVYSFGLILSELLTDRHALLDLTNTSKQEWRQAHAAQTPRTLRDTIPQIPPMLEALYQACLEKDPKQRPTALEAFTALQKAAGSLGLPPYSPPEILPRTPANVMRKWNNWANCYCQLGYQDEALKRIDRAIALGRDAVVLETRGSILCEMNRTQEALDMFTEALQTYSQTDPRRKITLTQRGICQLKQEQFQEAEKSFADALEIDETAWAIWYNRASNEHQWGLFEKKRSRKVEAVAHLDRAASHIDQAAVIDAEHPSTWRLSDEIYRDLQEARAN